MSSTIDSGWVTTSKQTAKDAIIVQHQQIALAIDLLTQDLNNMPFPTDNVSWGDVTRFAQVADMARTIIENYEAE